MNQQLLSMARYRVGQTVYRVAFVYPETSVEVPAEDEWMFTDKDVHPKAIYDRGLMSRPWKSSQSLPRVGPYEFTHLLGLLRARLSVVDFTITAVDKSRRTGEFEYWGVSLIMPESMLFATHVEARRECRRIKLMVRKWTRGEL